MAENLEHLGSKPKRPSKLSRSYHVVLQQKFKQEVEADVECLSPPSKPGSSTRSKNRPENIYAEIPEVKSEEIKNEPVDVGSTPTLAYTPYEPPNHDWSPKKKKKVTIDLTPRSVDDVIRDREGYCVPNWPRQEPQGYARVVRQILAQEPEIRSQAELELARGPEIPEMQEIPPRGQEVPIVAQPGTSGLNQHAQQERPSVLEIPISHSIAGELMQIRSTVPRKVWKRYEASIMEQYLEKNTQILKAVYNLNADTDFDIRRDLPGDISFEVMKEQLPVDTKQGDKLIEKINDSCVYKAILRRRIELASLRLINIKFKICRQLAIQTQIWSTYSAKIDAEIAGLKLLGEEAVTSGSMSSGEKSTLTTEMDNIDKRVAAIELLEHPDYWNEADIN